MRSIRSARPFMAPRVVSYDIVLEGKAHMLPRVIDPKPHALFPARVSTRQRTSRMVTRSTTRPPNLYGAR
jgi:hypothetical protein